MAKKAEKVRAGSYIEKEVLEMAQWNWMRHTGIRRVGVKKYRDNQKAMLY